MDNPWKHALKHVPERTAHALKPKRTGRPHALDRAKERYGIDLTIADLKEMTSRCRAGEGIQKNVAGLRQGARAHMLCLANMVIDCVWRPPNGDHNVDGFIVTILPAGTLARQTTYVDTGHAIRRLRSRN